MFIVCGLRSDVAWLRGGFAGMGWMWFNADPFCVLLLVVRYV